MASITVRINGVEAVRRNLGTYSADTTKGLKKAVAAALINIKGDAKERCPVNKKPRKGYVGGRLRNSIHEEVDRSGLSGKVVAGNAEVYYGEFVERGTRRMRAQPYMGPAFEAEMPAFQRRVEKAVGGSG